MARGCCGGAQCGCRISQTNAADGNQTIKVSGTGTTQDPFLLKGVALQIADTTTIDLTLVYDNASNRYTITGAFASTSKVGLLGDVNAPTPTNNQVLGYDTASGKWTPRAPTTAAAGAVAHDTSLTGDGSAGSNLQVRHAVSGYTSTTTAGINLTDEAVNSLVRRFATTTNRAAATPAPRVNTLSVLDSNPGQLDYWSGSAWLPLILLDSETGDALFEQSGAYIDNTATDAFNAIINTTSDGDGRVTLMDSSAEPLASAAGVLDFTLSIDSDTPVASWAYDISEGNLDIIIYAFDSTDLTLVPAPSVAFKAKLRAILY